MLLNMFGLDFSAEHPFIHCSWSTSAVQPVLLDLYCDRRPTLPPSLPPSLLDSSAQEPRLIVYIIR